jgi:nitrite reductase/ring-hydroxylating ferredoxin subunit
MQQRVSAQDVRRWDLSPWPRYAAAATGFREYWYPVMWSRQLGRKPVSLRLCDEQIMLMREGGQVRALSDQCPHRGIPLSVGKQVFPGTWSCRYHGWTFDLESGVLKAALTDGPDSPICGKVRVKTYPVEERAGLVWVYVGDGPPPPVEADIPAEFLHPDAVIVGRITIQKGNWRYACENGFDEGHAQFLHRYGAVYSAFRRMPAYRLTDVVADEDGYIGRQTRVSEDQGHYPGLGVWPPQRWWQAKGKGHRVCIRLPGLIRVKAAHQGHARFVWWTPVDKDHYRMLQFYVKPARGLAALKFALGYWLYRRPFHHVQFNDQDVWMVRLMPDTPPERLYRPDASITAWRKLCEQARGQPPAGGSLAQQWEELAEAPAHAAAEVPS